MSWFGPFAKKIAATAAQNPHVQRAMKSAATNFANHPQVRRGYNTARSAFQRQMAAFSGRNAPPSGNPKAGASSSGGSSAGSSASAAFSGMHAFWLKHKTAISSFVAANFMGILLLLQVGSGIWPLLKGAVFGHGHEQKRKKIKEKEAASTSGINDPANPQYNDLGSTQYSDKEDGMTFYNVTNAETISTNAMPLNRQEKRKHKQESKNQVQHQQAEADAEPLFATFTAPEETGNDAQHALPPPAGQSDQRGNVDFGDGHVSASAEEIFAYSKANSGAVATFDNSFHFKLGDNDGYQSSLFSEGVAGRDAKESSSTRKRGWFSGLFFKSDDPLIRPRSTSSVTSEETLVFDMRSDKRH